MGEASRPSFDLCELSEYGLVLGDRRFFFANQYTMPAETTETKIQEYASNDSRLDKARFRACLGDRVAEDVMVRDERLAHEYHVDAAPTIFINGVRKIGFSSPEELWSLVREAESATRLHATKAGLQEE